MNVPSTPSRNDAAFELRFTSLLDAGRAMAFPCDPAGCVELDALSERARSDYFYARAVIGHEFACPRVQPACLFH